MSNPWLEKLKQRQEIANEVKRIRNMQNPPNFISRLNESHLQTIPAWEKPNTVASHKLSYVTDDSGKAIVYPNVQRVENQLVDYTRPPYNKWAGYEHAVQTGDTLKMNPEVAKWFTTDNYKSLYNSTKQYAPNKYPIGGKLSNPIPILGGKWRLAQLIKQDPLVDTVYGGTLPEVKVVSTLPDKLRKLSERQRFNYSRGEQYGSDLMERAANSDLGKFAIGVGNFASTFRNAFEMVSNIPPFSAKYDWVGDISSIPSLLDQIYSEE